MQIATESGRGSAAIGGAVRRASTLPSINLPGTETPEAIKVSGWNNNWSDWDNSGGHNEWEDWNPDPPGGR